MTGNKTRVRLYDASGNPGHIGAVLMTETYCAWTHCAVSASTLALFASRRDSQIMGLELFSIALGLNTFKSQISNKRLIIYSDNTGSEVHTVNTRIEYSAWVSFVRQRFAKDMRGD